MIILPDRLQSWLSKQPEYAMGYQKVTATLGRWLYRERDRLQQPGLCEGNGRLIARGS